MNVDKLLAWYAQNKRDLPWRKTKNPYFIWLSEIILQQTRVDQGLPYYTAFTEHFPTIKDLAEARESEVLRLWQGLGYYSRARNLLASAKKINEDLNGVFPNTYDDILKLKGIGPYTAAAIASIAFDEKQAVVDGNVNRVLSRFYNLSEPINSSKGVKMYQALASDLIPEGDPASFNQAMMELGATICKPNRPDCTLCPIAHSCNGLEHAKVDVLPVKLKKVKVKTRNLQYMVISYDNEFVLKERLNGDVWQGLFDFPLIESNAEEDIFEYLKQNNLHYESIEKSLKLKHILTHQIIQAQFWLINLTERPSLIDGSFFSKSEIEQLPKPKLIVNYIQKKLK